MTDNRTAMELHVLRRENAELRRLMVDMWHGMWACAKERCPYRRHECYRVFGNGIGPARGEGECWFERRMKELKITEVDHER